MAPERLCLGCGLRAEEPFTPLATGERSKLFIAAQKLPMFVLNDVIVFHALRLALRPLIVNRDGYFVATVTTKLTVRLVVFEAGKTLSAAAMIEG